MEIKSRAGKHANVTNSRRHAPADTVSFQADRSTNQTRSQYSQASRAQGRAAGGAPLLPTPVSSTLDWSLSVRHWFDTVMSGVCVLVGRAVVDRRNARRDICF